MSEHGVDGLNSIERLDKEHVFGTWAYQSEVTPTEIVDADGVRFTDADGQSFIDFSGQLMCSNLGHSATKVSDAIAEQAPRYERLTAGQQRTVDRVIDNSTGEEIGYRPRVNEPYVDQLPTAIHKGETLYSITVYGHVDDFGPGFGGFVVGLGVAALGVVLLLAGGGLALYDRLRNQSA